ncbi:hypothetical protein EGW08_005066 [Elysia chlorotica]|uniref:Uncharacterized protein n=1 Tax=Elysia chlorotica TaxID=188477 RepID=A0A3S1BMQ8_ELYCH|nr:hypothetical protein EGW08_005066 [Elysia chlorotica]
METLKRTVEDWRKAEVLSNVKLGPETKLDEHVFTRFAKILNTITAWFRTASLAMERPHPELDLLAEADVAVKEFEEKFLYYEEEYIRRLIIVSLQPPQTRTVENEKVKKNSSEKSTNPEATTTEKKKKAADKAFGSKKQQGYNTKIRIPGGDQFSSLSFRKGHIACVSEAELAAAQEMGSEHSVKIENNLSWSEAKQDKGESANRRKCAEKEFVDVRISDHSREMGNKNHKEFVRIQYFLTLEVNGREFEVEILSLPFHFITGSNQLLSCLGSRLWYFGSKDMYNGDFKVPDSLPVDFVVDLLDKRIRYVHEKGRYLRKEEKTVLEKLLPSENGRISLHNFVKEGAVPKKEREHTFYVWFHAVVNMIETKWLSPWIDGAIYGLVDKNFGYNLLMTERVNSGSTKCSAPIGTVLLRPGQMALTKPNSQTPELVLVMQAKYRTLDPKNPADVMSIALKPSYIENNGFYGAVANVFDERTDETVATYLQGYKLRKGITFLKQYDQEKKEIDDHYRTEIRKMERMYISVLSASQREHSSNQGKAKRGRKSRPQSKSGSSAWTSSTSDSDRKSPLQERLPDMEEDDPSGACDSRAQPSSPPRRQISQEHTFVGVASLNGGTTMMKTSARNSPVSVEQQNYEMYNGVSVDTTAILKEIQREKLRKSPPGASKYGSDSASNFSPSSGVLTMSPLSEHTAMSPRVLPLAMSPYGESTPVAPKQEFPTSSPLQFPVTSSSVAAFDSLHELSGMDLQVGQGETITPQSGPQLSTEAGWGLNLPTILGEAEQQQPGPARGRRSTKGKQSAAQKTRKWREMEDKPKPEQQMIGQCGGPALPSAWPHLVTTGSGQYSASSGQDPDFQPVGLKLAPHQPANAAESARQQMLHAVQPSTNWNSVIQEVFEGNEAQNFIVTLEGEASATMYSLQQFDALALQEGQHLAETADFSEILEANRMDSGFGGDSMSPSTVPSNFSLEWKQ